MPEVPDKRLKLVAETYLTVPAHVGNREEPRAARPGTLLVNQSQSNATVLHVAASSMRAFHFQGEASRLLVDGPFRVMTVRVGTTLVDNPRRLSRFKGGLAPWQCKRSRDLMLADLADRPSISRIASACGLSNRHFLRAFKASNGLSPHRWLLRARVESARELLQKTGASIAEIAHTCGFADQSHLTRAFAKLLGSTPAAWRRAQHCRE